MPETPNPGTRVARRQNGRWSARKKLEVVRETFRPDRRLEEVAARHGVTVSQLQDWRDRLEEGALEALKERGRRDPKERRIAELERKIGQMAFDLDLKKKVERWARQGIGRESNDSSRPGSP
jgi:transposase